MAEGIQVKVLESGPELGGLWNYQEPSEQASAEPRIASPHRSPEKVIGPGI
jgi:hypothetical protein